METDTRTHPCHLHHKNNRCSCQLHQDLTTDKQNPTTHNKHTNNHKILGVSKISMRQELMTAYQRLAQEFHPDKWNTNKTITREKSIERFKIINNAYKGMREKAQL